MVKKTNLTPEQLTNDPSLRWNPYRRWELLYSDVHNTMLRFVRYEGSQIRLASLHGMAELPDLVEQRQVRRASLVQEKEPLTDQDKQRMLRVLQARSRKE